MCRTSEGYLALPVETLGIHYIVVTYSNLSPYYSGQFSKMSNCLHYSVSLNDDKIQQAYYVCIYSYMYYYYYLCVCMDRKVCMGLNVSGCVWIHCYIFTETFQAMKVVLLLLLLLFYCLFVCFFNFGVHFKTKNIIYFFYTYFRAVFKKLQTLPCSRLFNLLLNIPPFEGTTLLWY